MRETGRVRAWAGAGHNVDAVSMATARSLSSTCGERAAVHNNTALSGGVCGALTSKVWCLIGGCFSVFPVARLWTRYGTLEAGGTVATASGLRVKMDGGNKKVLTGRGNKSEAESAEAMRVAMEIHVAYREARQ